jgi:superfamily II DNA or RNA helicase
MSLSQSYILQDVVNLFGAQEIKRAEAYLNSIQDITIKSSNITALVKESPARRYKVNILFEKDKIGNLVLKPRCGCQMAFKCKHAAAVLLSVLSMPRALAVNPDVLKWADSFQYASEMSAKKPSKPPSKVERLCYTLACVSDDNSLNVILLYKAKFDLEGKLQSEPEEWGFSEQSLIKPPKFVTDEDLSVLRLMWKQRDGRVFHINSTSAHEILTRLLGMGCLLVRPKFGVKPTQLKPGKIRKARLEWGADKAGRMVMRVVGNEALRVYPCYEATWYVDVAASVIGQLKIDQTPSQVVQLLNMPPLSEVDVPAVTEILRTKVPDLPKPSLDALRKVSKPLVPVLSFDTSKTIWLSNFRGYKYGQGVDYACLAFRYGDAEFAFNHTTDFANLPTGETVWVKRDKKAEVQTLKDLARCNFQELPRYTLVINGVRQPVFVLESEKAWPDFMRQSVPKMRELGWDVVIPGDFRHNTLEVEAWEAEFDEEENGWFSLNMGIVVNGKRLALAPLLHALFKTDSRWLDAQQINAIDDKEAIQLTLPDEGKVKVPAERIKPLARTLIELFDGKGGDSLRISRFDVARISELADMQRWQFKGIEAVVSLAHKLKNTAGIQAVKPPENFALQLRPYQLEGLSWLQYLREQEISGILADDMGLGKTAQALAHLLLEKQANRMDKPALVVLPTSLIFNWKREAERFAPQLKVLSLHGKERNERFLGIKESDIILTTYPLLWRDEKALLEHEYHFLILDEAQTVKNVNSQAAQVVRKIQARHRLCLTGTPMENHLGELWTQFDFLLPGLLGDSKQFTRTWRTPIEKQGNQLRRDLLARRVRPFILRRRKEDVAQELPPKTLIVRTVELEGGQRDLYETVRIAMDLRVREEVQSKGFARSQIVILDALLKLRQVCCDPRLVKLENAKKVKERAKLDMLMEMLPELVSEGRRILVFSQFTSMLELIEIELATEKLGYVKLTGDTQNREEVVRRFQDGEAPIFLISLKAGGVGLNLNMADTVIHYDPWWNPAVENQATDRAHRLGQTKNVFVYKLVVAGSIEEKILALQEKKAELAAGILSEDSSGVVKFGEDDIAALLAPLPS